MLRHEPLPARPLVAIGAAVGAGAAAVGLLPSQSAFSPALPCWLAAVTCCGAWLWLHRRGRERAAARLVVAATFLAAGAWSCARRDLFAATDLAWQLAEQPTPVVLRATVVQSPRLVTPPAAGPGRIAGLGPASECLVAIEAMRDGGQWRQAAGRATMIVRSEPCELLAGSRVVVVGRGLRPAGPLNPGEPDFAARARAERCLSLVRVDSWDCVTLLSPPRRWSPLAALDRLQARAAAVLAARIAPERAPLAAALLLGHRGSLPRATADEFVLTGTIHVLAISGLHVGLLAAGLFFVLRAARVPRSAAVLGVAVVTGLYAVLVGSQTPVVRATLMVWAGCLAMVVNRRPATMTALAGAAILVVAWRPAEVMATGGQLSFLSTAVLVGVASALARPRQLDPIERLLERSRRPWERSLRRVVQAALACSISGLAVWLAAAPLVASRFHVVTPVAVVANLVIAPLVPLAMACGFLCLLAAPVSTGLSSVFAAGCDLSLAALEWLVSLAAAVPAGHAWVAGPPAWWLVGWYALLVAAMLWLRRDLLQRPLTWATAAGGWAVVGFVGVAAAGLVWPPPAGLRMVATAVGHGCGIVVRSPGGGCLVYDAGRLGSPATAERSLSAVLWSEGIARIDTLVISHADADHFNAVPGLLTRFTVGELLVPQALLGSGSAGVAELLAAATAAGVPVRMAEAGDAFPLDPLCRIRVLHPVAPADGAGEAGRGPGDDNASSLVLTVETAGRRLLLTGDLEGEALAAFAAARPGECDVLVAPHHGSVTSLPADIARATAPGVVLVSGRGGRSWPIVREAYATAVSGRSTAVFKTGGEGALAVTLTAAGIGVERFTAGRWRPLPGGGDQAAAGRAGLVSSQPAASRNSWLATYAASDKSTPLVNP